MSSVRILFLAANPGVTDQRALDEECAAIDRELRLAAHRDFDFVSRWAVTVDELMRHLNEQQPVIVHFSGAGAASGGIYLHGERGGAQLVTGEALVHMVEAAASSARLVVLNAGYAAAQAEALRGAVDCVVGMAGGIDDDTARSFAVAFYRALGTRRSVGNAMKQASATLAAKGLGAPLRCWCRDGLTAEDVMLGQHPLELSWAQRFAAVIRLCRDAHAEVASDPWSAAQRARSAIEHIIDYLHERELGTADAEATLRVKLNRVRAKLVIPPMVADHVDSVHSHTQSVIRVGGMAEGPDPALVRPCLASLILVVKWFFRDYLAQPAPDFGPETRPRERASIPDLTPINSTNGTLLNTQLATGIGELMPIWRSQPYASTLRLESEHDPLDHCAFRIEAAGRTYTIGRTEERRDGTRNDFALPEKWRSISRDQGTLARTDGGVLLRNSSTKKNVLVRSEAVAPGTGRLLRHGDVVQLGNCAGTFSDGRYYPATPAAAIDWRTGLLSRKGMITEVSGVLASGAQRLLFVVRCSDTAASPPGTRLDPEQRAAAVAMALHAHDPAWPVARIGIDAAAVLASEDAVAIAAGIAERVAGAPCVSGFMALKGSADQASPRLEACLGALSRIALADRDARASRDLARYALKPTSLAAFAEHARRLFDEGGGAVLFALGDLPRLRREAAQAVSVLELELIEMLGARMGPRDAVAFAGPGLLLFAMPGDVERFAHEIGAIWHARGPVTANALEIDRCLYAHLLTASDLDDAAARAASLAEGDSCALGASGLPAPLALAARAVDETRAPVDRARALVGLAELSWKLLAFVLVSAARGGDAPELAEAPWRSLARAAAQRLAGQPGRLAELAAIATAADRDDAYRSALDVIDAAARLLEAPGVDVHAVARGLPRLEHAIRALFAVLAPLRGWTLVSLLDTEFDVDGISQRIDYVDYTGPTTRGSPQRITVMGFRGLGRFCFLVRWNEGLAIALEPFVRRALNPATGDHELLLATALIREPGQHVYRSPASALAVSQAVTAKQLGPTTRRQAHGAAER